MVTLGDIQAAHARIGPHVRATPLIDSPWLSNAAGADIRLKLESLQITNAFKIRGALNALMRLAAETDPAARPAVVTASAGNHGRAIAMAAELTGLSVTVFTPHDAPRAKTDAIVAHGATLRSEARNYDEAEVLALEHARRTGAVFVSPYDHDDVIAGAGTIGLEIAEQWPDVEVVLVPIGGGGLISGIAVAMRSLRPVVRVIGVEVAASPAFTTAKRAGHVVTIEVGPTLADGLSGNLAPDTRTWPYVRDLVHDISLVTEDDLRAAFRGLAGRDHLIAEGAGIAGVAAAAARRVDLTGRRTAIVVSGANIDSERLVSCLREP